MAHTKQSYACTNCSYKTVKWIGCCPECQEWGSIAEVAASRSGLSDTRHTHQHRVATLKHIETAQIPRLVSGLDEWDRVVGGGLVPGSFYILTGDPGIGKSTLLLHVCELFSQQYSVLYNSTEESLEQIGRRAQRINCTGNSLLFADADSLVTVQQLAQQYQPVIIIIDSIQNIHTNSNAYPGSIAQLREAAFALMQLAKQHNICVIVTGHITKDGIIAGPKTLEHMVDGVLYLQGDPQGTIRTLRAVKNRFGSLGELGFFEMRDKGLNSAPDLNKKLLQHTSDAPGAVLVGSFEGSRPLLVELQALVVPSKLTMPQRIISGVDHKQVVLIAALLEKQLQIKLSAHDIFFKTSGSFKVQARYADLGIALALLSSYFQYNPLGQSIAVGEISITGDIRPLEKSALLLTYAQQLGVPIQLFPKHDDTRKSKDGDQSSSPSIRPTHALRHILELLQLFD